MVSVPEKGKYQQEQKQKYGVCSLDVVQEGSFAKTSISQEGQPERWQYAVNA